MGDIDIRFFIKDLIQHAEEKMLDPQLHKPYYQGRKDVAEAILAQMGMPSYASQSCVDGDAVRYMVRSTADSEIDAMHVIKLVLEGLDTPEQKRVLAWLHEIRKQKEYE